LQPQSRGTLLVLAVEAEGVEPVVPVASQPLVGARAPGDGAVCHGRSRVDRAAGGELPEDRASRGVERVHLIVRLRGRVAALHFGLAALHNLSGMKAGQSTGMILCR